MTHCFKNIFTVQNDIKQIYCEIVFVKISRKQIV